MATDPAPSVSARAGAPTLREVVDQLERVLAPLGWEQPPIAIGIEADGHVEMAVPPADLDDPIGALVGRDAEPEWTAYGVVTSGRVHDLADEAGRVYGRARPVEQRARMGHFVDRAGATVSYLQLCGEPLRRDDSPAVGRVDDVCRRALGLATPPPSAPMELFWAGRWLEDVLVTASRARIDLAWSRVVALHPASHPSARAVTRPLPSEPDPTSLAAAARRLASAWSWEDLRALVAEGGARTVDGVTPAAAAWMDAGMFSRWVLADAPPLAVLRAALAAAVPGPVAAAIDETLSAGGLP